MAKPINEETENLFKKVGIDKKYSVIQKIGEGGFGEVHLVEGIEDHKQYVVKAIHGRTRDENEWAKREIQFLKGIHHRNIVLYKEDFEFYGGVIVIMEFCSGGDLSKLIKARRASRHFFQEENVIDWLKQICEALQYLHSKNILHRDLKPANIFIAQGNVIKLGDFGVSRQLISKVDLATTMVGTPLYISPEMQRQEPYNHKSDVWSAGCSVYEMMTFQPAIDPMVVFITQQWQVREMPTNYSADLCDVIKKMLTIEAGSRPSISDILEYPILKTHQCVNEEPLPATDDSAAAAKPVYAQSTEEDKPPKPDPEKIPNSAEATPINSEDEEEDEEVARDFEKVTMEDVSEKTIRCVYTTQDLSTTMAPSFPKKPLLEQLHDLGYMFNDNRQLVTKSGERFRYDINNGDREANERHYQAVARVVNEYVGDLLEIELNMSRVTLPVDCTDGEPYTFIYATPDFLMNQDKLLILVGGACNIRAGVWSRKVVINDSLEAGSQMPVIRQAISEGYSVIILNQNQNDVVIDGVPFMIRDNQNAKQHALYVWDSIVIKNTRVRHVAFLTHSEGGRIVTQLAIEREEYFKRLVFGVAFCNSKHEDLLNSAPKSVVEFLNSHSRNWMVSNKPLDEPIGRTGLFSKKDLRKVSAGDQRPEWTVSTAKDSIFKYLHQSYCKATNMP